MGDCFIERFLKTEIWSEANLEIQENPDGRVLCRTITMWIWHHHCHNLVFWLCEFYFSSHPFLWPYLWLIGCIFLFLCFHWSPSSSSTMHLKSSFLCIGAISCPVCTMPKPLQKTFLDFGFLFTHMFSYVLVPTFIAHYFFTIPSYHLCCAIYFVHPHRSLLSLLYSITWDHIDCKM